MNNIDDAVTYDTDHPDTEEAGPSTSTSPPVNDNDVEEEDNRLLLMEMEKEELVSLTMKLQGEVSRSNNVINSLRLQREWVINKKPQLLELLDLIETLSDASKAEEQCSTRSIAATANPSLIDKTWGEACSSSEHRKQWWQSGKPKPLRGASNTAHNPNTRLGNTTTAPADTNTTQNIATQCSNPPSNSNTTPANSKITPENTNTQARNTVSTGINPRNCNCSNNNSTTTTIDHNNNNNNHNGNKNNNNNNYNNSNNMKKWRKTLKRQRPWKPDPTLDVAPPTRHQAHPRPLSTHGGYRGGNSSCCDYCFRPGHNAENCYTRATDHRQEMMLRRVLTENWGREQPAPQPPFHDPLQAPTRYQSSRWQTPRKQYSSRNPRYWQGGY